MSNITSYTCALAVLLTALTWLGSHRPPRYIWTHCSSHGHTSSIWLHHPSPPRPPAARDAQRPAPRYCLGSLLDPYWRSACISARRGYPPKCRTLTLPDLWSAASIIGRRCTNHPRAALGSPSHRNHCSCLTKYAHFVPSPEPFRSNSRLPRHPVHRAGPSSQSPLHHSVLLSSCRPQQ